MKIVDVLGARAFKDGERIITQVGCENTRDACFFFSAFEVRLTFLSSLLSSLRWQGDEADCFYIVESGEVKIMIKSKVSNPKTESALTYR